MSASDSVHCERLDHILRIVLNRPGQRNAQDQAMLIQLGEALDRGIADEEVRVIVIAGEGEHFSSGHDLKSAENYGRGYTVEERYAFESRHYFDIAMKVWDCPKPTVASVQGACIAAGFMLANMCDLIVASEDAYFSDPVVNLFGAAAVEVLIHPSALGQRRAKDLLFTGRRMTALEAFQCGMVSRLVTREDLTAATMDLGRQIAEAPPFALRLIKGSLHRAMDIQGFRAGLEAHFDTHQLSHVTDEFAGRTGAGTLGRLK